MFDLSGRSALVTGAGQGVGTGIARVLAAAGADVVVNDLVPERADAVAAELGCRALPFDVADRAATASAVASAGRIDILVNNAGISPFRSKIEDTRISGWDKIFAVNVRGCFLCSQAAGRVMIEQGGGVIINVASILGKVTQPGLAAYSSSKAAVLAFTEVMAEEWAQYNIRVNALGAGWTATQFTEVLRQDDAASGDIVSRTPMRRFAEPEEMVGAAVYLASDAASFVTGAPLWVSGGYR